MRDLGRRDESVVLLLYHLDLSVVHGDFEHRDQVVLGELSQDRTADEVRKALATPQQILFRLDDRELVATAVCVRTRLDFIAISDGHRVLVESTAAGVRREISYYEDDALQKLADLKSENFYVTIEEAEGRLSRELKRPVLLDTFKRFIESHDLDEVQGLVAGLGESARPRCTISFDEWKLSVSLWPASPARRRPRDNRVNPSPPSRSNYSPVMDARRSIKGKLAKYSLVDDTLILAVTVYNLWPQDLSSVANEAVFGKGGIWHGKGSPRPTPAAVLFCSNTRPYAVQSIASCLFVNPSINLDDLPPALLDLPRTKGSNDFESVEGKSVADILGLLPT